MQTVVLTSVALLAALCIQCLGESRGVKCFRHNVSDKMLEQLSTAVHHVKNSLPRDDNKHKKLLPKFTGTLKKPKGLSLIKEMLDFYLNDVFSNESLNTRDNEKIQIILSRMVNEVSQCLRMHRSSLSSNERDKIHQMKQTFRQLETNGMKKAIGEFKTVLVWIHIYMHHTGKSGRKRQ
ncbi:interleukin-10-like [Brienomyrus brachyistius]|uniref:interleukin-10-like n=1 Tax=Brienomyrus brachyistius TaxID=42636 RepID=UPI0020B46179|nr:interleukin-10-like [Brienomyrus brachyistius]